MPSNAIKGPNRFLIGLLLSRKYLNWLAYPAESGDGGAQNLNIQANYFAFGVDVGNALARSDLSLLPRANIAFVLVRKKSYIILILNVACVFLLAGFYYKSASSSGPAGFGKKFAGKTTRRLRSQACNAN